MSSSYSSGTVSTACTSSGSRLSSVSLVAATSLDWWELDVEKKAKEEEEEELEYMKSLVHEFFAGVPPSGNGSINVIGNMSVLERWLTELGVSWVLHLAASDDSSFDVPSWVRALTKIVETMGFMTSRLFAENCGFAMPILSEEEEQPPTTEIDQLQFASFFQETMSKMLAFVDSLVLVVGSDHDQQAVALVSDGVHASYGKLGSLLAVRGALSKALPHIQLASSNSKSLLSAVQVLQSIQGDMVSLFSAKEAKAGEAAWSKMEEIRSRILGQKIMDEDGDHPQSSSSSSGIHKATQTVASYIRLLQANYSTAAPLVFEATSLGRYEPRTRNIPPLNCMIIEMSSCLEQKLVTKSRALFSDPSLQILFLLNNSHFIWHQEVWCSAFQSNGTPPYNSKFWPFMQYHMDDVAHKVQGYIELYLQASWAPVLSCLSNRHTAPRFRRKNNCSPSMSKFEFEFEKTYSTQKLWKVPDPMLRKRLRKAITNKIVPDYTKYIEDNNITAPKFSPQELEDMLQELFEA